MRPTGLTLVLIGLISVRVPAQTAPEPSSDEEAPDSTDTYDALLKEGGNSYDPQIYYVGEVVVTGRRIANMEQAGTSTVIDDEKIKAHGYKTLDQVLDRIPGVTTYRHTKGHTRVRMRGFDQDKVMVLVDGVPINDVYATDVDIASVSVNHISKIVVNRGVSSALYGTGGAIGTINVISKKPQQPFAEATTELGSHNNHTVNLAYGAPIGDFYYLLTGTLIYTDGFEPSRKLDADTRRAWFDKVIPYGLYPVGDPFGTGSVNTFDDVTIPAKNQYLNDHGLWEHNDYAKYFATAKAAYAISSNLDLGVSSELFWFKGNTNTYQVNGYSVYRGTRWKPRYPHFGDEQDQVKKFALRNRSFVWPYVYRFEVAPYLRWRAGDFSVKLHTFYLQGGSKQDGYADNGHDYVKSDTILLKGQEIYEPFHDYKTYSSTGFRLMPSYRFAKWHRLSMSIHFRHDNYLGQEQAINRTLSPEIHGLMGGSPYTVEDLAAQFLSVGIEDELHLWGRLKLAVGVSYDMQNFARFKARVGQDFEDAYIVDDNATIMGTRDSFNPALGIVFDPIKRRFRLRAAGAIKIRFPTLGEYAKVKSEELDKGLMPEQSYNANAGAEVFLMDKAVSLRVDYFLSIIDDRIQKLGSDEPPTNVDRVVTQGVEAIISAKLLDLGDLDLISSASYAYIHARNRDYSDNSMANKGPYVERTPEHEINLDLRFLLKTDTAFDIWATVISNQKLYVMESRPIETESSYSTDYFTTIWLHNPVFLSARVSQALLDHYELTFTVRNLLDDYGPDPFNPGPGRMFYLAFGGRWE